MLILFLMLCGLSHGCGLDEADISSRSKCVIRTGQAEESRLAFLDMLEKCQADFNLPELPQLPESFKTPHNTMSDGKLELRMLEPLGIDFELMFDLKNPQWVEFSKDKKPDDEICLEELFKTFGELKLKVPFAHQHDYEIIALNLTSFIEVLKILQQESLHPRNIFMSKIPESIAHLKRGIYFSNKALIFEILDEKILAVGIQGSEIVQNFMIGRITTDELCRAQSFKIAVLYVKKDKLTAVMLKELPKITGPDGKEYCFPCTRENMRLLQEKLPAFATEGPSVYSLLSEVLRPVEDLC